MEIVQLIEIIKKQKSTNQFDKYIDFIQFPFYRNVEIDTKITFNFPLTIFIGQNGCGKSSCLHALYGAPDRYTPYRFWFDTKVDPVNYYDEQRKRHSFWYSFVDNKGKVKEVIKARIKRQDDPNYWETSRPLAWAGMQKRANKNERDSPLTKNVVYLDFRAELSAFDKYFYFGDLKNISSRNKQEFIRRKSVSLNNLFTGKKQKISSSSRVLNRPVETLDSLELKWISFILGRSYIKGISVLHELFRNEGYSALFQTNFAQYSEAVAGSGEMAVLRLVREILSAEAFSLILLDEPEVSLHPGAQIRLKAFLLEQIMVKKHQIIISSHSPSIVKDLPKEAIKVFYQNPKNGRFLVKENLTPYEAFYHIESPVDNKKIIIVEDILAKNIINNVLKVMGEETSNLFNIKFNPGGESVIKKEFIPVFCREENTKEFIFFDGDQKPLIPHYNWRNFSQVELNQTNFLKTKIKQQTGEEIKFSVDGGHAGGNNEQQNDLYKKYLDYFLGNVFYLPKNIPEEIIWDAEFAQNQIKVIVIKEFEIDEHIYELEKAENLKEKFAVLAKIVFGNSNAQSINYIHNQFIQKWLNVQNEDFKLIKAGIVRILN